MEVRVLFFARSRELAGVSETTLSLESGATTTTLLQRLLHQVRWVGASALLLPPAVPDESHQLCSWQPLCLA